MPEQGDQVTIVSDIQSAFYGIPLGANVSLLVDDSRIDGAGGAKLILKRVA